MIEDMRLSGLSASTQRLYADAVGQLARYFHRSPDQLDEENLREYFLYLTGEKKVSRSTTTIALCGVKFLFEKTLRRQWLTLELIRPAFEKKLPAVLSREEVRRILNEVQKPGLSRLPENDLFVRAADFGRDPPAGCPYR
jgi:site-specific recombinase XerD